MRNPVNAPACVLVLCASNAGENPSGVLGAQFSVMSNSSPAEERSTGLDPNGNDHGTNSASVE